MSANAITDWIKDPNTAFLFGAGCSKCADKPLMNELTDTVLKTANSAALNKLVSELQSPLERVLKLPD